MPSFGIKTQVALLSLGLIAIPVIGLNYWQQVKETTLDTHAHIQEIEAKAIATNLLVTQENLEELLAASSQSELFKYSLSAPPISSPVILDGYLDDWPDDVVNRSLTTYSEPYWQREDMGEIESSFSLQLAQSAQHLYLGLSIEDELISYRRNHLRLDYNDHVRLTYLSSDGSRRQIILPAEREGALASYFTDDKWEYGIKPNSHTASHQTNIQGFWRRTTSGYNLEFRLPIEELSQNQAYIHLTVVDVDKEPSLGPTAILSTLPTELEEELNPIELHARELQRIIDELKHAYARLGIYDLEGRQWALSTRTVQQDNFQLDTDCVNNSLKGITQQKRHQEESDVRITTCYPIIKNKQTIGSVVIDEVASHILEQQKDRLQRIALQTGISIACIITLMFIYAVFLARRISNLSRATHSAIDEHGRISETTITASQNAPDELGELSRSITELLVQQKSYTQFLERIPQTLRHEISNPLNKLRTSLENLLDEAPSLEANRYVIKLESGIDQITNITHQLTEAASLEAALQNESLKRLDIVSFLSAYSSSWDKLKSELPQEEIWVMAESARLEQLLDKLLDNAFSFCPDNGRVKISTSPSRLYVRINIENDGPTIPANKIRELFAPMTSTRLKGDAIHLGLGLHIAKLVADHHHAKLSCYNKKDGSGVVFYIDLPRYY